MPLLATEAPDLGHGHAGYSGSLEGVFHLFELVRLDDGFDLLHVVLLAWRPAVSGPIP